MERTFLSISDHLFSYCERHPFRSWRQTAWRALESSGPRRHLRHTTDTAALEEAKANDRYYGLETKTPRLVVAIHAEAPKMLDLTSTRVRRRLGITLAELAQEDWRKLLQAGQESLSQALGRAAAEVGASGVLVRSAAIRNAHNVVIFPPAGHLSVIEGAALSRLTKATKA